MSIMLFCKSLNEKASGRLEYGDESEVGADFFAQHKYEKV